MFFELNCLTFDVLFHVINILFELKGLKSCECVVILFVSNALMQSSEFSEVVIFCFC
jgi:hypothetical protein